MQVQESSAESMHGKLALWTPKTFANMVYKIGLGQGLRLKTPNSLLMVNAFVSEATRRFKYALEKHATADPLASVNAALESQDGFPSYSSSFHFLSQFYDKQKKEPLDEKWFKPAYDEMVAKLFDGKAWAPQLSLDEAKLLVFSFAQYMADEGFLQIDTNGGNNPVEHDLSHVMFSRAKDALTRLRLNGFLEALRTIREYQAGGGSLPESTVVGMVYDEEGFGITDSLMKELVAGSDETYKLKMMFGAVVPLRNSVMRLVSDEMFRDIMEAIQFPFFPSEFGASPKKPFEAMHMKFNSDWVKPDSPESQTGNPKESRSSKGKKDDNSSDGSDARADDNDDKAEDSDADGSGSDDSKEQEGSLGGGGDQDMRDADHNAKSDDASSVISGGSASSINSEDSACMKKKRYRGTFKKDPRPDDEIIKLFMAGQDLGFEPKEVFRHLDGTYDGDAYPSLKSIDALIDQDRAALIAQVHAVVSAAKSGDKDAAGKTFESLLSTRVQVLPYVAANFKLLMDFVMASDAQTEEGADATAVTSLLQKARRNTLAAVAPVTSSEAKDPDSNSQSDSIDLESDDTLAIRCKDDEVTTMFQGVASTIQVAAAGLTSPSIRCIAFHGDGQENIEDKWDSRRDPTYRYDGISVVDRFIDLFAVFHDAGSVPASDAKVKTWLYSCPTCSDMRFNLPSSLDPWSDYDNLEAETRNASDKMLIYLLFNDEDRLRTLISASNGICKSLKSRWTSRIHDSEREHNPYCDSDLDGAPGMNALHFACTQGVSPDLVKLLFESFPFSVNEGMFDGTTALSLAVAYKQNAQLDYLLERPGIRVGVCSMSETDHETRQQINCAGFNALHHAVNASNRYAAKKIISKEKEIIKKKQEKKKAASGVTTDADVPTPMRIFGVKKESSGLAAENTGVVSVNNLPMDTSTLFEAECAPSKGSTLTPLHMAAAIGTGKRMIDLLISEGGADVNARTEPNYTSAGRILHIWAWDGDDDFEYNEEQEAGESNDRDTIKVPLTTVLILGRRAAASHVPATPLHLVSRNRDARALLSHGANILALDGRLKFAVDCIPSKTMKEKARMYMQTRPQYKELLLVCKRRGLTKELAKKVLDYAVRMDIKREYVSSLNQEIYGEQQYLGVMACACLYHAKSSARVRDNNNNNYKQVYDRMRARMKDSDVNGALLACLEFDTGDGLPEGVTENDLKELRQVVESYVKSMKIEKATAMWRKMPYGSKEAFTLDEKDPESLFRDI